MSKTLILLVKIGISTGLLFWLYRQATEAASFERLADTPKDWPLLGLAWAFSFLAVLLTLVRWHLLVRALGLPFRFADALRLGFLGYLLNFFSLGSVGGDLFKAVFIAREQPGRRPEAVATVFIDRLVGLYALLLVATAAVLAGGFTRHEQEPLRLVARATLGLSGLGALGLVALLLPGVTGGTVSRWLSRLPAVGSMAERLVRAVRIYRRRLDVVILALLLSLGVHTLMTLSFDCIARGLLPVAPALGESFLVVPLSLLASALPLPFAGLGALEGALDFLYRSVAAGGAILAGDGLVVALCFRIITMTIACIGLYYWLAARREVADTMERAEAGIDLG